MGDALSWPEQMERHQRILNERPIPSMRLQRIPSVPIPITARVVWERDGEEQRATLARGWTRRLVLVALDREHRWPTLAVWLTPADVRRR